MDVVREIISYVLHLDVHLAAIVADYGAWTYAILWLIIFCETGLIVTPFLPGDSLLFATGALAATASLDIVGLFVGLTIAAVIGDAVNYWVGARVGPRLFDGRIPWLKRAYLERTQAFYARYGAKTIVIARFVPIVRTVAPFVAGAAIMTYRQFALYNVVGATVWVGITLFGGYLFGNVPIVKDNFGLVVIAIIAISLLPAVVEVVRARRAGAAGRRS
jgi:membrane-associated protein